MRTTRDEKDEMAGILRDGGYDPAIVEKLWARGFSADNLSYRLRSSRDLEGFERAYGLVKVGKAKRGKARASAERVKEMREALAREGYEPSAASALLAEQVGPDDLADRGRYPEMRELLRKLATRFSLTRERLDRGGYTSSGRYFGAGAPLWRYESGDGQLDGYVRGADREAAKVNVRKETRLPRATFGR